MKKIYILIFILFFPTLVLAESEIEKAATFIQQEVEFASDYSWFAGYSTEYLYGIATANYVSTNVNPYTYRYLYNQGVYINNEETALLYHGGLCGLQTLVFQRIIEQLGFETRTVQIYQISQANGDGHCLAEMYWNNCWHLFDLSYATFFRDPGQPDAIFSLAQVCNVPNYYDYIVRNNTYLISESYFLNQINRYAYLTSVTKDIIYSGDGIINLTPSNGVYSLLHVPNHVGKYWFVNDNKISLIKYRLKNINGYSYLRVSVSGIGGSAGRIYFKGINKTVWYNIAIGTWNYNISMLDLTNGLEMWAEPTQGDIYYVVFSSLEANWGD